LGWVRTKNVRETWRRTDLRMDPLVVATPLFCFGDQLERSVAVVTRNHYLARNHVSRPKLQERGKVVTIRTICCKNRARWSTFHAIATIKQRPSKKAASNVSPPHCVCDRQICFLSCGRYSSSRPPDKSPSSSPARSRSRSPGELSERRASRKWSRARGR